METTSKVIWEKLIRDGRSKATMPTKIVNLLPKHSLVSSINIFSSYYKSSAYYTEEYTQTNMPVVYSQHSWLKFCQAGLIKIHDLMWGKTSSVAAAMMTGKYKGGTSRSSLFVALERSFFRIGFFPVRELRRNGTYITGGPYLRFLCHWKELLATLFIINIL